MTRHVSHSRRGFTLVEVTLVAMLTVFLAVLLSSVWKNISLFTTDALGRGQLMQEMDMAAASFSRDLAGTLPVLANATFSGSDQKVDANRWVAWKIESGTYGDELWLAYDASNNPNGSPDWTGAVGSDAIVRYYLSDDPNSDVTTKILIREFKRDETTTSFIVARGLNSMAVAADGDYVKITLQFKFQRRAGTRYFGPEYLRTLSLEAKVPQ
jgi:type II secretory pathway pseudopilin PulG